MSILLNGDCLEELKGIEEDSVDLVFCDLPYGQTSCTWDNKIDLEQFWKQIMRVKKLHTPIFMTTTTKFGVDLICSAPKKCPFRYDIVWVKSSSAGFLSAKKMPMRKHEMVYVFYEKLPFYDLSSHKHKFIKHKEGQIKPPTKSDNSPYGGEASRKKQLKLCVGGKAGSYDPPLPVSVVKEDIRKDKHETAYGKNVHYHNNNQKNGESIYDPPLPLSVIKDTALGTNTYNTEKRKTPIVRLNNEVVYDPPLPNSMLDIKSTRGKHSTEKPIALIEWILKYYSKPGDVVLDPTMGSGSCGVACVNMNRNFIGIEMDGEIYEVAVNRIEK
tara:strand:+ start:1263 stop:2246 length:984 start_codon:yes stop_codon:yes gene_type:complete